jgi:hypothetical protein
MENLENIENEKILQSFIDFVKYCEENNIQISYWIF